jgi:hypothetical protein
MVTDISGQHSSQAVQDLAYLTALWNISSVLSSTKQGMPCRAKKDTTHKHTFDTYYEEVTIPKNGHHCRMMPLGSDASCKTDIGQISRRRIKINLTQI